MKSQDSRPLHEGSLLSYSVLDDGAVQIQFKKPFSITGFLVVVGFFIFWFSIVAFITFTPPNSFIIKIFTIPFWVIGFIVVFGLLFSYLKKERIKLYPKHLELFRTNIYGGKTFRWDFSEIKSIERDFHPSIKKFFDEGKNPKYGPPIMFKTDDDQVFCFSDVSERDKEWLFNHLKNIWEERKDHIL